MKTPRIEEMVEEFEDIFVYDEELSEGFERPIGSKPSFRKEVKAEHMGDVLRLVKESKDWLRTALTKAHQAGIDDAVEKIEKLRQPFKVSENMELREAYNKALDDTIKALQDNK